MSATATVDIGRDGIEVACPSTSKPALLEASLLDDADGLARALGDALGGMECRSGAPVEVRLHPPVVQARTLSDLPPVRRGDLAGLVGNHSDRFFRPTSGPPVVSAVWMRASDGRRVVRAALADLALLERIEDAVASAGYTVRRIVTVDAAHRALPMLTPDARARRARRTLAHVGGMVTLAAAGWLVAGATYVVDLARDEQMIASRLQELEAPLASIDSLEGRMRAFSPVAAALGTGIEDGAWATTTLLGLADALPVHAHLHALTVEAGPEASMAVHTDRPVAVVDALSERWSGSARIETPAEPAPEQGDSATAYTLVLERGS